MSHDAGARCVCVRRHIPAVLEYVIHHIQPLADGGPDTPENRTWLCPTTHYNVHQWLRWWDGYTPDQPGPPRGYAYYLARRGRRSP